jgi:hypothetical protein
LEGDIVGIVLVVKLLEHVDEVVALPQGFVALKLQRLRHALPVFHRPYQPIDFDLDEVEVFADVFDGVAPTPWRGSGVDRG